MRTLLLTKLRKLGVTQVDCYYTGYGDSGQVEYVKTTPEVGISDIIDEIPHPWKPNETMQRSLRSALDDFFWGLAYDTNPGFENNDGGQGEMVWNIETDKISLDHGWNETITNHDATVEL